MSPGRSRYLIIGLVVVLSNGYVTADVLVLFPWPSVLPGTEFTRIPKPGEDE